MTGAALQVRRLLALDTATENCSAALWIDGDVRSVQQELGRGHAEAILPMIESLLSAARLKLTDLDALAVGRGPGGFTGVRLAISVAQGLAFGAHKPVVPVSDLRAVAQRAFELAPEARRCIVCADARMREVYAGQFTRGAAGLAEPAPAGAADEAATEAVLPPDAVGLPAGVAAADGIVRPDAALTVLAGRGFRAYPELSERARATGLPLFDDLLPGAVQIATLAVADAARGAAVPASMLRPVYLRDQVARPSGRT